MAGLYVFLVTKKQIITDGSLLKKIFDKIFLRR